MRSRSDSSEDEIVKNTDNDALQSRISAIDAGYLLDPSNLTKAFVQRPVQRKAPVINRGTYIRTIAIDKLVQQFVDSKEISEARQIVSLGAGSDSRYFRLQVLAHYPSLTYHEIDFPSVIKKKARKIAESAVLQSQIDAEYGEFNAETGHLISKNYCLHPFDLRDILEHSAQLTRFIDLRLPTLFISECCLIYLEPEQAGDVLKWITSSFSDYVSIVIYEPIGGHDAFGKVMIQNLAVLHLFVNANYRLVVLF